jgi:hypothetical protein
MISAMLVAAGNDLLVTLKDFCVTYTAGMSLLEFLYNLHYGNAGSEVLL